MARNRQVARERITKKANSLEALKPVFLQTFRKKKFINTTCNALGINRDTFYSWLEKDPIFSKDFEIANEDVTEIAEAIAWKLAFEGIEDPVFQGGKKVGTILRYSEKLIELLLKSRNRSKYGERIDYHIDEQAVATAIAARFVGIVRRVAPDVCPGCKTRLDLSSKIAEELLGLSAPLVQTKS